MSVAEAIFDSLVAGIAIGFMLGHWVTKHYGSAEEPKP